MGLRICMVTPFAWSQPHPVNEHVAASAEELRRRGHEVVVLAPSNRGGDLAGGRRALRRLSREGVPLEGTVALGPAIPVSRRSRMGVPLGVRANLELALSADSFDLVHAHEPGLPSLSYLALRHAPGLSVATFHSAEALGYPPGKQQRERLLSRIDALTAVGVKTLAAARARFPGEYRELPHGIATPAGDGETAKRFVLEWRADELIRARNALKALRDLPGWELLLLRTRPLAGRPYIPLVVRDRVQVRTALDPAARAKALAGATAFIPAQRGLERLALEAQSAGIPLLAPPGSDKQPELVAAAMARIAESDEWRMRLSDEGRKRAARESVTLLGDELERVYRSVLGRRRRAPARSDPLGDRPFILCDLHMHTEHSHDCAVPVAELLDYAEAQGLGAIAITDHNVFGGAREAVGLARGRKLVVIPGEEVKTDGHGEVIGLFLREEIPRGLSFADTVAAIKEQDGLVYLPHPFDRMHSIADPATLQRHLADIDVFEVYNARLLFEAYNDEALRFARKYNLTMGAGSDAHVLQGVGTGGVRMRAFEGPEEFLLSLRSAQILRRPRSLVYLQSLKWMAQAKERVR
jgi:predicted metal-dependent phosphoesterase TrpH/glycosyltransferase involved in cell wall biosynthesis